MISGKDLMYKFLWIINDGGCDGVGILLAEERVEYVLEIKCFYNRFCCIKLKGGVSYYLSSQYMLLKVALVIG